MRYERIKVKRDDYTTYNREFLPWEVPVLEFTFGDGNVEHTGVFVDTKEDYPDAREEMFRLEKVYGSDRKTDVPHVMSVYGQATLGISRLRQAIEEAKKAARVRTPKQSRKQLVKEFANDPLLSGTRG